MSGLAVVKTTAVFVLLLLLVTVVGVFLLGGRTW
jgi:hypothetical protein